MFLPSFKVNTWVVVEVSSINNVNTPNFKKILSAFLDIFISLIIFCLRWSDSDLFLYYKKFWLIVNVGHHPPSHLNRAWWLCDREIMKIRFDIMMINEGFFVKDRFFLSTNRMKSQFSVSHSIIVGPVA